MIQAEARLVRAGCRPEAHAPLYVEKAGRQAGGRAAGRAGRKGGRANRQGGQANWPGPPALHPADPPQLPWHCPAHLCIVSAAPSAVTSSTSASGPS